MIKYYKQESLEKMEKGELIEQVVKLQRANWLYEKSYYVKPGGEYIIEGFRIPSGKLLHKIIYDYDERTGEITPLTVRATKLAFLPEEYREIEGTFRIKIKKMRESLYKKGFDWVSSIVVEDCEIIPLGEKPEEKMEELTKKYKEMLDQKTEDDYLF